VRRPHVSRSQSQHDGMDADVGEEYDPDSTSPRGHRYRSSRHRSHHGRVSKNRRDGFAPDRVNHSTLSTITRAGSVSESISRPTDLKKPN